MTLVSEYLKKVGRPFVLQQADKYIHKSVRKEVIKYFADHKIVWWDSRTVPTGHLLSSQISCLNHLFFLRNDEKAALQILQNINANFVAVLPAFENGYVGFEVTGKGSYLNEGTTQTRGANCTCIDAMMLGVLANGKKIQIVIEWKCTESYTPSDKSAGSSGKTRKDRYDELIDALDSPIQRTVDLHNFYYEPFYQLMRQSLLAWQMTKHKAQELGADDYIHLDVIPENNLHLRYKVTAPDFIQTGLEEAWKSELKNPEKYRIITPQFLLKPLLFKRKHQAMMKYLNKRYW